MSRRYWRDAARSLPREAANCSTANLEDRGAVHDRRATQRHAEPKANARADPAAASKAEATDPQANARGDGRSPRWAGEVILQKPPAGRVVIGPVGHSKAAYQVSFGTPDVRPHVQAALKRLNTAQDSLLTLIFAK